MKAGKEFIGVGCAAIILKEEKVLLLERAREGEPVMWSLPGGSIELNEGREAAIKREVREEVGVDIQVKHLITVLETFEEQGHWITFGFTADILKGKPRNCEPGNCKKIQWFSLDALPENIFLPSRLVIDDYVKITGFYKEQLREGIFKARLGARNK